MSRRSATRLSVRLRLKSIGAALLRTPTIKDAWSSPKNETPSSCSLEGVSFLGLLHASLIVGVLRSAAPIDFNLSRTLKRVADLRLIHQHFQLGDRRRTKINAASITHEPAAPFSFF